MQSLNFAEHKLPYDYITSNLSLLSSFLRFLSSILKIFINIIIMKSQIILTLLFLSALATKERDSNQEALEGFWSYFDQDGPYTVTNCGTD